MLGYSVRLIGNCYLLDFEHRNTVTVTHLQKVILFLCDIIPRNYVNLGRLVLHDEAEYGEVRVVAGSQPQSCFRRYSAVDGLYDLVRLE